MRKITRRAERNKTIAINQDDLKDIVPAKQATKENSEIENKFIEALKEYINAKMTISAEQTEVAIKQVLNFIDLIKEEKDTNPDIQLQSGIGGNSNQSEHFKPSSEQPKQKNDEDKPKISGYIAVSSGQPQEETCSIPQSKPSNIHKIPTKIINSNTKVHNLAQSFEQAMDGVINTNECCNKNVIICKNDIIQERTFNFQTLLSLFENK